MIAAPLAQARGEGATDGSLIEAVREGDDAAFGELYRRHQPEIARFVRGRVRDHGRAEDLTQDAFLSALRRLRQTDGDIAFRPWMFEIARNATIDSYRRSSRAEEVSIDAESMQPADVRRLPGGPQPERSLDAHQNLDSLREALHELSSTHRRAIVLRELEGRSYREIGDSLELSQAAVESTLFRARRKLEYEYTELDSGRRCRLVGAAIGRLAEGLESDRDRRRLDRHARRCSACRRSARKLGVEPMLPRRHIAPRAAALLPMPAFLRRRFGGDASLAGDAGQTSGLAFAPAVEMASGVGSKAVALVVTAVFVGGGGATLGGAGPLAPEGKPALEETASPKPDAKPARSGAGNGLSGERTRPPFVAERNPATTRPAPDVPAAARDKSQPGGESGPEMGSRPIPAKPGTEPAPALPGSPDSAPENAGPPEMPEIGAPSAPATPGAPQPGSLHGAAPAGAWENVPSAASAPLGAALSAAMAQTQR